MKVDEKEKHIELIYTSHISIIVENIEKRLNIKWKNVVEWYVKYCELHIKVKAEDVGTDDRERFNWFSVQLDPPESDYKWADRTVTYDKDYNEIYVEVSPLMKEYANE